VIAAVLVPGGGHLMLYRRAAGVARLLVFAIWAGAGGRWLFAGTPVARVPGLVLVTGALLLWASGVVDVAGLTGPGAREPIGNRGLLWLVVGVTIVLALAVTGATVTAVRP
jgi:hypothetical protein